MNSQIKRGAIISYFAIFFNIVAGLIYTPWMIQQIGISDYGLYALILSFLSYFLIDFGLGSAVARFIAKFRVEGDALRINNMLGVTTRIYLILDLIILLSLAVLYFFISNIFVELTQDEIEKLKVVYLIAGFFSVASFIFTPVDGALIAYERFFILKIADLFQKAFVIIFMVVALYMGYGLFSLVFINGVFGFIIKLYKYIYIKKYAKFKINIKYFDKPLAKELFSFSSWMFIISIAQRLLVNIVPTILGVFSGSEQIALFAIAMTFQSFIWSFAYALNGLFLPKVSRMVSVGGNRKEVTNLMIKVGRIQLLIVGLLIIGVVTMGKSFIQLWMGVDFTQSYYILILLVSPGIITFTQDIANTLLLAENEVKYRAILFIFASFLSVIIGVVLSPQMGALGAAIGVCTALILCHVIGMNIVYSKVLKLEIGRFFKSVHLQMIWPLFFVGSLSVFGQQYYPIKSWLSFLVSGFAFISIYSVMMWTMVMNKEEKSVVFSVINKLKK